jgi:uncharacterized protein YqgV (UPF0045/DUF77 family)
LELPEDLSKLLELIKNYIKENGGLSKPSIDKEIWEEIDALVKAIKSLNLPYTLKDISTELGVSYSSFMQYYKNYQKSIKNDEQSNEQPKVEVNRPKTKEENVEEEPKNVEENQEKDQRALEDSTRTMLLKKVRQTYLKKAEPITVEHADKIVGLGERFINNYGNSCIQSGYEKLEDCMDDAMEALFQIKPDYEYLKDLFDKSTDAIAKLMYLLAQYVKRTQDLELIEKIITGEIDEEMYNLENEENAN